MIKAVLFDLDGTVLDRSTSLKAFLVWQAQGMLRNSITDVEQFCQRFIELDANGKVWKDKVYAQIIDEFNIDDWTVSELLQSYVLCFSGFCIPKAGVINVIETLHANGIKLGLVSNGKSPFQERNFNALGISHLFSTVVVSEAVGIRKPDSGIFELACRQLGVSAKESAFIGDNPSADIDGANKLGMFTVYIPSHYGQTYEHADYVCDDYAELPNIITCVV